MNPKNRLVQVRTASMHPERTHLLRCQHIPKARRHAPPYPPKLGWPPLGACPAGPTPFSSQLPTIPGRYASAQKCLVEGPAVRVGLVVAPPPPPLPRALQAWSLLLHMTSRLIPPARRDAIHMYTWSDRSSRTVSVDHNDEETHFHVTCPLLPYCMWIPAVTEHSCTEDRLTTKLCG